MKKELVLLLCVVLGLLVVSLEAKGVGKSRGFNDKIEWYNDLEQAKSVSKATGKPIFLLIHKSWCGACKQLKSSVANNKQVEELSKNFVMVNLEDDEEPSGEEFRIDGGYIPRVYYLQNGQVQPKIYNKEGHPQYKYFYSNADALVNGMKSALKELGSSAPKKDSHDDL